MKLLSEIPQNLPYFFEYENPQKTFIIFHFMEWEKDKVPRDEKDHQA